MPRKEIHALWQDNRVFLALMAIAGPAAALSVEPGPQWRLAYLACATVAGAIGALSGPLGGLLAGLSASAGYVVIHGVAGGWSNGEARRSLSAILALVVFGSLAGWAANGLRERDRQLRQAAESITPGAVLGLSEAQLLLDGETARARTHGRPLALVLFRMKVLGEASADFEAACRRYLRTIVQSRSGPGDIPFENTPGEFAVLLPERGHYDAAEFGWKVETATRTTRVWSHTATEKPSGNGAQSSEADSLDPASDKEDPLPPRLADTIRLDILVATLGPTVTDGAALLAAATLAPTIEQFASTDPSMTSISSPSTSSLG